MVLSNNILVRDKTSSFLEKGENKAFVLDVGNFDGHVKVIYNNLLTPSQQYDTLSIRITSAEYFVPGQTYAFGGGGVFIGEPYYGCNGFPFSARFGIDPIKTSCGSKVVKIRKRKMGIVTTSIDTVKVYPNQTSTVEINW